LYGKIVGGELVTSEVMLNGYKLIEYAPIPEFDQETKYIVQELPADAGDYIECGIRIEDMPDGESDQTI